MTYTTTNGGRFKSVRMAVHMLTHHHAWETPRGLFDALNAEFAFTIDLAASSENALLPRYYDEAADALMQDWSSERGFLNPPYDRRRQNWFVEKAAFEAARGALVVVLIPARTDTVLWHETILPKATEIRFLRGRIRFGGTNGSHGAPFPSAVIVFAPPEPL